MKYLSLIILLILISCSDNKINPQVDLTIETQKIPVQESWNSKIMFSEEGQIKAVLFTDHLQVFEKENETTLDKVRIEFLDEFGNVSSILTSKRGRIDRLTKDMFAIDSVVAVSDSGVTLRSDELIWNNKTQKITTDKFVVIEDSTNNERIEGFGFESDQQIYNYKIFNITYFTNLNETK